MENEGGLKIGKEENSEKTPESHDLIHHKCHSAVTEIGSDGRQLVLICRDG